MIKSILVLLALVLIDQVIKVIIFFNFMLLDIRILGNKAGFLPHINIEQMSIFNHELKLGLGLVCLIILNLISLGLLTIIYYRFKKKEFTNHFFQVTFLFIMAGSICSLLDKIVYGGSLDYILFYKDILDLKDIYLILAIVFLFLYTITYLNHMFKLHRINKKG